jgi:hypothetical protein
MAIDVRPSLPPHEREAIAGLLASAGVDLDETPTAYSSRWLRLGLREAVQARPERSRAAAPYARSPRSTRGATRA